MKQFLRIKDPKILKVLNVTVCEQNASGTCVTLERVYVKKTKNGSNIMKP